MQGNLRTLGLFFASLSLLNVCSLSFPSSPSLSPSQVPVADRDIFLCFGPVVPDGYGVCYNPQEKRYLFSVTSFHDCPQTDSMHYAHKLKESLLEMRQMVLEGSAKAPSAKL